MNSLKALQNYGQSIWLHYLRRSLIINGELQRMVLEDGIRGVVSHPAFFEKAITGSADYSDALKTIGRADPQSIYEQIAIRDVQDAADVLRPIYKQTNRMDGYVSLAVSPYLAHDTQRTVEEARRLWDLVCRRNLMLIIPSTKEGVAAIRQLISEGINVNATLLFSQQAYESLAEAYISGLELLVSRGGDLSAVAGVASFGVNRIDAAIDSILSGRLKTSADAGEQTLLRNLAGKVAVASARVTYERWKRLFQGERWQALAQKGAQKQRLVWSNTMVKNPAYPDVLYVEELIGPETVNAMSPTTLAAFRDHGRAWAGLESDIEGSHDTMIALEQTGISPQQVSEQLFSEGLELLKEAFDRLLDSVGGQAQAGYAPETDGQIWRLPAPLDQAVKTSLEEWRVEGNVGRLWNRDASLWTGAGETSWMGWLGITEDHLAHYRHLQDVAQDVRGAGFTHVLLLGMGGSSLCPEVMRMTFGKMDGYPELYVLDSTDPAQVTAFESKLDLAKTLFIVSSKSGTTLEPNIFEQYFFDRILQIAGADRAGSHFIAITDPGSKLHKTAERDRFRHIFFGLPSIGGRYSALSDFGMAPAAIMGVNARQVLDRADLMVHACGPSVPPEENPGVVLGVILGVLARRGRDKVTIVASPAISNLGAWLEQLLAESTGKNGKGLIPVDRELLGPPEVYGDDRLFIYLRYASAPHPVHDQALDLLEAAGQPVVRISVQDRYDLGQEFFRWEIATAVAGSILNINPFDQPDVEASKVATRELTSEYEETGLLPRETPLFQESGIKLFADAKNGQALERLSKTRSLAQYLRAHLSRLAPGDYFAILAYIEMNEEHEGLLQSMRLAVRDRKRVATCLGFGPRFLHSTGQAYKGGPNTGVFLQITCDDAVDLQVPGQRYTFGVVKAAQARGDFQVLVERNRRAVRVHLDTNLKQGLETLRDVVGQAVG